MKETSDAVAAIAAKGMTTALNRTEQKAVCASALAQHEVMASLPKIKRRINRIKKRFPAVAADLDELLAYINPTK